MPKQPQTIPRTVGTSAFTRRDDRDDGPESVAAKRAKEGLDGRPRFVPLATAPEGIGADAASERASAPMTATVRFAALLVSLAALVLCAVNAGFDRENALLGPRGGIVSLGVSLALCNVLIWLAGQEHREIRQRVQYAIAAWIWLLVQTVLVAVALYQNLAAGAA